MTSSDDTVLSQPQPSGEWLREHARRLADDAARNDADDTGGFLASIQARASSELARWASVSCGGSVDNVDACSDACRDACIEREHLMCPRRQVARLAAEARVTHAARRKELGDAGVSPKALRAVFDAEPWQTPAVLALRDAFAGKPRPSIVLLQGGTGCGKTCAAALWAVGNGARWITAKAFARLGYDDELTRLGRASALVFDDLGTEFVDAKGFFLSNLDGLIDDRYARELPTVITTNVAPEEFKGRYGERIADRIRESGKFLRVKGASLRGKQ